jgi:hypothetical protein
MKDETSESIAFILQPSSLSSSAWLTAGQWSKDRYDWPQETPFVTAP